MKIPALRYLNFVYLAWVRSCAGSLTCNTTRAATRSLPWSLASLAVASLLAGCSGFSSSGSLGSTTPTTVLEITDGSPPTVGLSSPDFKGAFKAFQDVLFQYQISTTVTSPTYTVANKPSWLNLNSGTGLLSGTPTDLMTYSNITIAVSGASGSQTLGPFSITVVGDPMKQYQWHLKNTGQSAFAGHTGTVDQDIHLDATINSGIFGSGIKVAVSDSGVYEAHRALKPNLSTSTSRNYLNNYASTGSWLGNSSPDTSDVENAHGTAVAGLIGARGWLGIGGRGVAPLASVTGFLFIQAQDQLQSNGYMTQAYYDQFDGAFDVFNYSWGDSQCSLSQESPGYKYKLKTGIGSLRGGKGASYLKAAGNEFHGYLSDCQSGVSQTAYYLGNANFSEGNSTPYMIVVGAVNAKGKSSSYSSPGANVWVSAPGGEYGYSTYSDNTSVALDPALMTTDFPGCSLGIKSAGTNVFDQGQNPNGACEHTATMNGTSGATPITSGVVALMLSANPALTWRDVKHILASTSDKIDPTSTNISHPVSSSNLTGHVYEPGWTTNTAGFHFHNWYGFGRVNADAAVNMAKTYVSALGTFNETNTVTSSSVTWKYNSGALALAVPAGSATGVSRTLAVTESYTLESVQIMLSATGCVGNLGVEITSPSGTKSVVMNYNSGLLDSSISSHTFLSNAFYGENSSGSWTLTLIGAKSSCTTTWNNWSLNVAGH